MNDKELKIKLSEMKCKCGKCKQVTNMPFFVKLNQSREYSTVPFFINSGDRCKEHNENEGGSPTSSHLKGVAADIMCSDDSARSVIVTALLKAGFTRIGISKNFIHVDDDKDKPKNVMWVY